MKKYLSLSTLVLIVACTTPSSVDPVSIPLEYKTTAPVGDFPALPSCTAVSSVDVADGRNEKALGKRFIEGNTSAGTAPVTASTDVAAWVKAGSESALKRAGVSVGTAGAPALRIRIDQINTTENILHRSGYEGRILLSAELRRAGGSAACWQERSEGSAENYGYRGSVQNYQETLNHALDRAMIRTLSAPDFKKAVCSCP